MHKYLRQSLPLFLAVAVISPFFCKSTTTKPKITLAQPELQKNHLKEAVSPEREIIKSITERLIGYILDEKPGEIVKLAHPEGVYVDIKAQIPPEELATAWSDPKSMLYALYWNTSLYRKISGDIKVECFRDILTKAPKITLDVTLSGQSATVKLDFPGRPSPMMMGDLIFEKTGKKWYVKGLF